MDNENSGTAASPPGKLPRQTKRDLRNLLGRIARQGLGCLFVMILSCGFFQFSHRYLVQTVQVDGYSMSPTLPNHECYILNRIVYFLREPKPRDIVVLRDPETNGCAVKRIVARPGDRVYVQGGRLFVNGELLAEPYLEPGTRTFADPHYRAQMWICGVNQYFVLGDNRNDSADSRIYGAVPRENILGTITP
jgi:signal peptidase I